MGRYIIKRLMTSILVIWFVITITFILMNSIPGNPFDQEKMPNAKIKAAMMAKYGLDKPLHERYLLYLKNFIQGDFGVSYLKTGVTVKQMIIEGAPYSIRIGLYATFVVILVGIPVGIWTALRQNKLEDHIFMILATLFATIPSFVLATGFLYLFNRILGVVPAFGVDEAKGYIGPVLVIAAFSTAFITRLTKSTILEIEQQDFMRTARSKGISEFKVIVKHGLRNALLPVVTYLGPMIASIMTGSFVIEKVFGIPGIGSLFTNSILSRDYTVILGITVFYAIFLIAAVLVVDILYVFIDPRIKYTK